MLAMQIERVRQIMMVVYVSYQQEVTMPIARRYLLMQKSVMSHISTEKNIVRWRMNYMFCVFAPPILTTGRICIQLLIMITF